MDERQGGRLSARDAALARVRRAKRWVAGGAVALTGVFSAVAAHALPADHSSKKTTAAPSAPAATSLPQDSEDQQTPISPPQQAPQPSSSSSGAVSGGS